MVRSFMASASPAYTSDASMSISEMSFSASASTMRAFFLRSATASCAMASCSSFGSTMSRISTSMMVMPHGLSFSSMASFSSSSNWSRRVATSATVARPMALRMAVCAIHDTADA